MTQDNQISLTDELYSKDIEIAEFHAKLSDIEKRIHFVRTIISAAKLQYRNSDRLYKALDEEKKVLTSMLDWLSDALFYMGEASEDVKTKSLDKYKELRDLDGVAISKQRINLKKLAREILGFRSELLRVSGDYWDRVNEVKPCESIFEILIDEVAREAIKKAREIEFYSYG